MSVYNVIFKVCGKFIFAHYYVDHTVYTIQLGIENIQVHVILWCTLLKYDYHATIKISALCQYFYMNIYETDFSVNITS